MVHVDLLYYWVISWNDDMAVGSRRKENIAVLRIMRVIR